MKSIKAIVAGSIFIIIVSLFIQLAYIFIAVAYNALIKDYPALIEIGGAFRYILGIPAFMLTMFLGGYITAYIAAIRVLLHCFVVGLITAGGMLLMALENTDLTLTGIIVFVIALATTMAGGMYWQRDDNKGIETGDS